MTSPQFRIYKDRYVCVFEQTQAGVVRGRAAFHEQMLFFI